MEAALNGLIGLILPPVIDFINQKITNSRLRYVSTIVICVIVGALLNLNQLQAHNVPAFLGYAALVFTAAQTTHNLYWKNTGAHDKLSPNP